MNAFGLKIAGCELAGDNMGLPFSWSQVNKGIIFGNEGQIKFFVL